MWIQKIRSLFTGFYNFLLLFLTLLFVFRPFNDNFIVFSVWQLLLTMVLLSAVFNANHHRAVKITVMLLAIPTIIFCWLTLLQHTPFIFITTTCLLILFLSICSASIIYDVVIHARVTVETLRGVVCAYFMVAFLFAYLYYLIEFIAPDSFYLIHRQADFSYARYISELLYFSFITLLTIGFGDITPTGTWAQTAVVIQGIIGQFYIAILVARIVAVYSFLDKKFLKAIRETTSRKKLGNNKQRK